MVKHISNKLYCIYIANKSNASDIKSNYEALSLGLNTRGTHCRFALDP